MEDQRGGIEKDGNRQINSATIQEEEITLQLYLGHLIRHDSSQLQPIEGKIEGRRSHGRPGTTWLMEWTNRTGITN